MEAVPITVSCTGLVNVISTVTATTTDFARQFRTARDDVMSLERQLYSVKQVLELLLVDTEEQEWFGTSDPLGRRIYGIIEDCTLVVNRIADFLDGHRARAAGRPIEWSAEDSKDTVKLWMGLETYKCALDIALNMVNFSLVGAMRQDTEKIQPNMDIVRSDSTRILVDVAALKGRLSQRGLADGLALKRLEKFLDDSTTYAETTYEASMYDRDEIFLSDEAEPVPPLPQPRTPLLRPRKRDPWLPGLKESERCSVSTISAMVLPSPLEPGTPGAPKGEQSRPASVQTTGSTAFKDRRPPRLESLHYPVFELEGSGASYEMDGSGASFEMEGSPVSSAIARDTEKYFREYDRDSRRHSPITMSKRPDSAQSPLKSAAYYRGFPSPASTVENLPGHSIIDAGAIVAARRAREALNPSEQVKLDQALKRVTRHSTLADFRRLLIDGADPNSTIDNRMPYQTYALYESALHCRTDILRVLLAYGADPNLHSRGSNAMPINSSFNPIHNESFGLPLQAAAARCDSAALDHLLHAGAEINAVSGFYGTAIQAAAAKGDAGFVCLNLLLQAGADPNILNGYFQTALQAAARAGHLPSIEKLLEAGADPNPKATGGPYGTALHAATASGHVEAVRLLLRAGANKWTKARCTFVEKSLMGGRDVSELISAEDMAARVHKGGKKARDKMMEMYMNWRG